MIRSMTETDYIKEAKSALLKLCGTEFPDEYLEPFPAKVEKSLILCPDTGCVLNDEFMKSLSAVASKFGDNGFYMSANYKKRSDGDFPSHWYVTFDEILNYEKITYSFTISYIFYSPQSLWGIVSSDEIHSVFGGVSSLVNEVIQPLPEINNEVLDFIRYWKKSKKDFPEKTNASWMEILLRNIYGEKEAENLLLKSSWDEIAEINKLFPFSPDFKFG